MNSRYKNINRLFLAFSMFSVISCGMFFTSCKDEILGDIEDNLQNEINDSEYGDLVLNIPVSLGDISSSRATTETDGGSSEGQFAATTLENTMEEYHFFFRAWETDANGENGKWVNKIYKYFPKTAENKIVFNNIGNEENISTDKKIIPITLTADELKSLAGHEEVQIFLVGNITQDFLKNEFYSDENTKVNLISNFDPDAFIYGIIHADYSLTTTKTKWIGLQRFPMDNKTNPGISLPLINKTLCTVDFSDISAGHVDAYIKREGLGEESAMEVATKIHNILNIFKDKDGKNYLALERISARIDLANGCPREDGLYPLKPTDENCPIFARLDRVTPINVSRYTYIFRHSAKGNNDGIFYDGSNLSMTLLGNENGENSTSNNYNWIVDPDYDFKWNWKDDGLNDGHSQNSNTELQNHFLGMLIKVDLSSIYPPDGFIGNTFLDEKIRGNTNKYYLYKDANYSYVDPKDPKKKKYFPYWYVTENTLPSQGSTVMAMTTGLRFSFLLCDIEEEQKQGQYVSLTPERAIELAKEWEAKGEGFGYKMRVVDEFVPHQGWVPNVLYLSIGDEEVRIIYDTNYNGYVLNYEYYFHHNYFSQNFISPMKYATVRNNIYRVSVTGLNGLPRPYVTDEPVDNQNFGLIVDFSILPWGVRSEEDIILQ